jgi:hypothetical protein
MFTYKLLWLNCIVGNQVIKNSTTTTHLSDITKFRVTTCSLLSWHMKMDPQKIKEFTMIQELLHSWENCKITNWPFGTHPTLLESLQIFHKIMQIMHIYHELNRSLTLLTWFITSQAVYISWTYHLQQEFYGWLTDQMFKNKNSQLSTSLVEP